MTRWINKSSGKKPLIKTRRYKCQGLGCGKDSSSTRIYKIYYCEECEAKGLRSKRSFWQMIYDWM